MPFSSAGPLWRQSRQLTRGPSGSSSTTTIRSVEPSNERRITEIRQAIPATTDEAVLTAFVMVVQWIRIIFHCWQTHTLYNKRTYLSALQKRGSSLMKLLAEAPA